jgi:hypothetical protein
MAKKARNVLTLKHGRGKVHELNCRWLNGAKATTDWSKYDTVRADQVQGKAHCSHCA